MKFFMYCICVCSFVLGGSVTEFIPCYVNDVKDAVEKDSVFNIFRSLNGMRTVYEHVSAEQALNFCSRIEMDYPYLYQYSELFSLNDSIGSPSVIEAKNFGAIAPTTLRYIYFLGEMLDLFSLQNGCKIVEVGCGYGGQCSIISRLVNFEIYKLIDLDYVCPLIEKYLKAVNVENFETMSGSNAILEETFDLFISNYGISECWKKDQDYYLENVIRFCKRGYILYNNCGGGNVYTLEEFCARLKKYGLEPKIVKETVSTCPSNRLIYWGADKK
jgi:hypothetical protein